MENIRLVMPTLEYKNSIETYKEEFIKSGDSMAGCGSLRTNSVQDWLKELDLLLSETPPIDKVPSTTYLAVDSNNEVVGVVEFRHHIDHPILSTWGGHIGYSVRPNKRRRGIATEIVALLLPKIKEFGLDKVLVTCDPNNFGSKKTILNNGGEYEGMIEREPGKFAERYWITL